MQHEDQRSVSSDTQIAGLSHHAQVMLATMSLAGWAFKRRSDGAWWVYDRTGHVRQCWYSMNILVGEAWKVFKEEEQRNGQEQVHGQPTSR